MMRPIDMHIAVGTLPDHARAFGLEQAGATYRSLQSMAEARNENLTRPERVAESPQGQQSAFQTIAQGQPDLYGKTRAAFLKDEINHYRKRKDSEEVITYNRDGKTLEKQQPHGSLLNLIA